ncbi:MAG: radical SAM protein [Planctomycetes bacterium]|nr:radical SAM protein [Planctomycetota bacterium]
MPHPGSIPIPTPGSSDPHPIRLVFWETTAGCNLECTHCRRLDVSRELMKTDLTTDEGKRLIDQIAETGRPVLIFSGGEPLMRPDIFDLAAHAKSRGLIIALASNGTLIDEALAQRIAHAGFDRVSVSLDGADAATHDGFRMQAGAFDRAMAALGHLRRLGVETQINCTIARHDKDQIEAVLRLAEQVGAVAVHYFLLVPVGCGEQIAEDQMLDRDEVEDRLRLIDNLQQTTPLQIKPTCAPHYYRIIRQQAKEQNRPRSGHGRQGALHSITRGCLAGTAVCFVSHEGKVFPCGYLPVEAGDIRKTSFGEIWRNSELFRQLRDFSLLTGKCGICPFKNVCGGCRARAFYEFSDYLAEEPFCAYEPKEETAKDEGGRMKDETRQTWPPLAER